MSDRHQARRRGQWAETLCAWHLRLRGWRIVARGMQFGRGRGAGEIDILARRGNILAVIEVKARAELAAAAEAVGARQRTRLVRAAEAVLARRPDLAGLDVRFDVMLVSPKRLPVHLPDAFRAE